MHSACLSTFPARTARLGVRTVATHPNAARAAHKSPLGFYNSLVHSGILKQNTSQIRALKGLDTVLTEVRRRAGQQAGSSLTGTEDPVVKTHDADAFPAAQELPRYSDCALDVFQESSCSPEVIDSIVPFAAGLPVGTVHKSARLQGMYLHGEVGCGKTMLMDMFYHSCPVEKKRRVHLTDFMLEMHRRLHCLTVESMRKRKEEGQQWPEVRQLDLLATEVADESWVLCFDEFQVTDIADAVLLTGLFNLFFQKGVIVVATSNKAPDALYHMNLDFTHFVEELQTRCIVHHLHRQEDYRLTSTRATNTYFVPNNERTRQKLFTLFTRLTPHEVVKGARLNVVGTRYITIPYKSGLCAMFSFWDLCSDEKALGPADYAAIARTYHTVFINGIPKIGLINRHEGRRFISLVDELYQYKVKLVCTASEWPHALFNYEKQSDDETQERFASYYADVDDFSHAQDDQSQGNRADFDKRFTGEEEIFTFRRVESRLSEMMSVEYLRLQHLCFVTQDVDVDLLLRSDSIEPYPILPASAEAVTLQAGRGGESGGMGQGYA